MPSAPIAVAAVPVADAPSPTDGSSKRCVKPDPVKHREHLDALNATVAQLKAKLDVIHMQLPDNRPNKDGTPKPAAPLDPVAAKRKEIKDQLDTAITKRNQLQESRNMAVEQLKQIQESMKKKGDDLKVSRDRLGYRSGDDCDKQIIFLEKQLNAGNISLAEEKKIVQEISQVKKVKKMLEKFGGQQVAIEGDKSKLDTLRKKVTDLDSERDGVRAVIEKIKAELTLLDSGRKDKQESLNSLHTQRKALKAQLDAAYNEIRESRTQYKDAQQAWYDWTKTDRERKQKEIEAKLQEGRDERMRKIAERELENAEIPAFIEEINLCNSLIHHFQSFVIGGSNKSTVSAPSGSSASSHSVRKVTDVPEGQVLRKKEPEMFMFMGKAPAAKKSVAPSAVNATPVKSTPFRLDFKTIEELGKLNIALPASASDAPATVAALEVKMNHFKDSQAKQTVANKAAAIAKMEALKAKVAAGEVVEELAAEEAAELEEAADK